ncbi:MAG TPA: ATP synthase F1 subunit delta [Flavobacteriaceae bacterium]|nr:ATP synthase F1 subunit delta [Flavobacteriaceae bacterium]
MSSRAAIRYAKALLEQAGEANIQDVIFGDMRSVYDTIQGSRELQVALQSPVIKAEDKKQILEKIFTDQDKLTLSLIRVLAANRRTDILGQVAKSFVDLYKTQKGIKDAKVITAVPLTDAMEEKVMAKVKQLTGSQSVTLTNEVDANILGGFILRVGDVQYDASIRNQFENLKKQFTSQYN